MKRKISIDKFILYLIVFLMIIECNSIYTRIVNFNINFQIIYVIVILLFMFITLIKNTTFSKKGCLLIFATIILTILFLILNVRVAINDFIIKFLLLLPCLLLYMIKSPENLLNVKKVLVNETFIIAIISLVLYTIALFFGFGHHTVLIKWGGIHKINQLFMLQFNPQNSYLFNTELLRNTGFFLESPMYAFVLSISLALSLEETKKIKRNVIFLALITTLSTSGIICACLLIFINKFIITDKKIAIKKLFMPIFTIILIFVGVSLLENKMQNESWSYNLRMEDYVVTFKAWQDHKIIGNGYQDTSKAIYYMNNERKLNEDKLGLSNGFGRIISEGGIVLFLFYIIPIVKSIILSFKNKDKWVFELSVVFVFLLITTNVPYQFLTLLVWSILTTYAFIYKKLKVSIDG